MSAPQHTPGIPGMYDFRDVGHGDVMLRFCRPDGEFGASQIIDYCDLAKNVVALESMGWVRACGVPAWSLRARVQGLEIYGFENGKPSLRPAGLGAVLYEAMANAEGRA